MRLRAVREVSYIVVLVLRLVAIFTLFLSEIRQRTRDYDAKRTQQQMNRRRLVWAIILCIYIDQMHYYT